jgi:hypothetical protein
MNLRPAWTTQQNPISNNNRKKEKKTLNIEQETSERSILPLIYVGEDFKGIFILLEV